MKRIKLLGLTTVIMLIMLVAGCSGGGVLTMDLTPNPHASYLAGQFNESIIGLFMVNLDTDNLTIKATPIKSRFGSEVGDIFFDLEITDFMTFPYCPDETCLKVSGVGVLSDAISGDVTPDLVFDISLKHPFSHYNSTLPVSGTNRADLDVFNPRVYILNAGNQDPLVMTSETGKVTDTGLSNPLGGTISTNLNFVQNADGWNSCADGNSVNALDGLTPEETSILLTYQIPSEFPATSCHPYLNFFYGTATDGGTNNPKPDDCRMSQGETAVTRTAQLNIEPGEGEIKFALAVSASFGQSAKGRANRIPTKCKYFAPAFNTHIPIISELQVLAPDTGDMIDGRLTVKVRDMQSNSTGVAASMDAYKTQADGGKLLPPEILDYSNTSFPKITGLTLNDYLIGGNGEVVYRIVDSDEVEVIPETAVAGSTATGTGTAADPYVFLITLPYVSFTVSSHYTIYCLVKDGLCDHTSGSFANKWDFKWAAFMAN